MTPHHAKREMKKVEDDEDCVLLGACLCRRPCQWDHLAIWH